MAKKIPDEVLLELFKSTKREDGFINATAWCKKFWRNWGSFGNAVATKKHLEKISSQLGVDQADLVEKGRGPGAQTYVHPLLFDELLLWLERSSRTSIASVLAGESTNEPSPKESAESTCFLQMTEADILQALDSGEKFPYPLESVWQWLGYPRKDHAVRALTNTKNGLIRGEDFSSKMGKRESSGASRHQVVTEYYLSSDGFKVFCMATHTERGNQVRRWYLAVEKQWREMKADPSRPSNLQLQAIMLQLMPNAWKRQFDQVYYDHLYRLKGLLNKGKGHPSIFAAYTLEFVYDRMKGDLTPELQRLKAEHPEISQVKLHQFFSEEGLKIFEMLLFEVITVFASSRSIEEVRERFALMDNGVAQCNFLPEGGRVFTMGSKRYSKKAYSQGNLLGDQAV